MKIFISVSAGVTQARWDAMKTSERKAYLTKYPNSKYATDKAAKKSKTANEQPEKTFAVKVNLDEGFSTKDELDAHLKKVNKELKTNVSYESARKAKYGMTVQLKGSNKDLRKFLDYHELDDDMDNIQAAEVKSEIKDNLSKMAAVKAKAVKGGKLGEYNLTREDGKTLNINEFMFHPFSGGSVKSAKGLEKGVAGSISLYKKDLDSVEARIKAKKFDRKFTKARLTADVESYKKRIDSLNKLAKFLKIK